MRASDICTMNSKPGPTEEREWRGIHHPWAYSPLAFRWFGESIAGINFLPLASETRAWLLRSGNLSLMPAPERPARGGFTNPYTESGVTLQILLSKVVNASFGYSTTETPDDNEVDAEAERIRLYSEVLLYSARLCEAMIKQLLYCTQIPEPRYKQMALGALLESPCPACKRQSGGVPHLVSLVGTLAHPFHLCLEFEHCAMDHMDLVNRLRNAEAAHASVQHFNVRTVQESKAQLKRDSDEALNGFVHMLSHLEKLERSMLFDLADKADAVNRLKNDGLRAADCNFRLVPGEPFNFASPTL